ncbi:hypothetical protein G7Y79_00037g073940 [Physcia stellaris]|nr:hypothetical protein G7Y79_00037g073940 [Physcia stellaris]
MNGMGGGIIDGSGTIDPAALNTPVSAIPNSSSSNNASKANPRGIKRSRSPEQITDVPLDDDTDDKPRKRGRPPKTKGGGVSESPTQVPQTLPSQVRTPQQQTQSLPQQANNSPSQTSPPKATPTKTVLKALPTVRDHTTDQLSQDGDEYIPREHDEAGEKKVSPMGHPLEGRQYKCRTFYVPNRGEKLFMLATECARVLNYRDSYLLFNKNRSLYKIIASQPEKDDLISQEILPYSYRSRQIAIVTAKSMFRQFGSRVIQDGRRVRDDYWEAKARKQGFTEEDAAGEKRPGAAKARDAAAAEAVQNAGVAGLGHPDIIYGSGPLDHNGQPQSLQPAMGSHMPATLAPLPMIIPSDDRGLRDYGTGGTPRPRQEMTGPPYQDRTQPTSATEIMHQASTTSELNKTFNEQRKLRGNLLIDNWHRPHEVPVSTPQQPLESSPVTTQSLQSPQASRAMINTGPQQMLQHQSSQMMSPQPYSQQPHPGNPISQSPRGVHQAMRPEQLQHRSSALSYAPGPPGQGSPYGYPQSSSAWGQPPLNHNNRLLQVIITYHSIAHPTSKAHTPRNLRINPLNCTTPKAVAPCTAAWATRTSPPG